MIHGLRMKWSLKAMIFMSLVMILLQMDGLQCSTNSGIIQVIEGSTAQISCMDIIQQQDSTDAGDVLHLILFYRGDVRMKPVFTYDARRVVARQWTSPEYNGARLQFQVDSFRLEIANVSSRDRGWWHCRVEFETSSFRVQSTEIAVVEKPADPIILNHHGQILHHIDGIFDEGGQVQLLCQARLSTPVSSLTWFVDGQLWAGGNAPSLIRAGHVNKMLHIEQIERHYTGKLLTCQSSNSRLTSPKNASLTLHLNLRPQKMEIRDEYHSLPKQALALTINKMQRALCRVYGSRPAANVSWWRGETKLPTVERFGQEDGVEFLEIIYEWKPSIEDDGHSLTCRAVHSKFSDLRMERNIALDIYHPPIVDIQLFDGTRSVATAEEDGQLSLQCSVRAAKPAVRSYRWFFNNESIDESDSSVTFTGDSLIVHRISRFQSGRYACAARNSQGLGQKDCISIEVLHVPICQWNKMASKLYVSNKADSTLTASCYVEAKPAVEYFWWTYYSVNRTPEAVNIPTAWHTELEGHSQLKINPFSSPWIGHSWIVTIHLNLAKPSSREQNGANDSDVPDGWLLCWAKNSVGIIREPCKIALYPAGVPQRPRSCTATQLQGTLISCSPGLDGGSPASFVMELWRPGGQHPFGTWTNTKAEFNLPSMTLAPSSSSSSALNEQQVIEVRIFAMNSHGRSDAISLYLVKEKLPLSRLGVDSGRNSNWYPPTIFPWLGGIIAAVFSVLTAVVLVGMMCGRCGTPATRAGRSAGLGSNNKVIRSKSSATIDADFFVANRRWSETSM